MMDVVVVEEEGGGDGRCTMFFSFSFLNFERRR